jgi:hypothetical protein
VTKIISPRNDVRRSTGGNEIMTNTFKNLQAAAKRRCRLLKKDADGYWIIEAHSNVAFRQWGISRGGAGDSYRTLEDVREALASLPVIGTLQQLRKENREWCAKLMEETNMTRRYVRSSVPTVPKSISEGRVLCHNHVRHGADTPSGHNGFRAWTDTAIPEGFVKCPCGYAALPHYAVRRHVSVYRKDGRLKATGEFDQAAVD